MTTTWTWTSIIIVALTASLSAQTPPPVQGTEALEGTMKKFYKATNTIIVETIDGVEHAYIFTKDLVVHGGKHAGTDPLSGLQPGTTVVIHYRGDGAAASPEELDVVGGGGEPTIVTLDVSPWLARSNHERCPLNVASA